MTSGQAYLIALTSPPVLRLPLPILRSRAYPPPPAKLSLLPAPAAPALKPALEGDTAAHIMEAVEEIEYEGLDPNAGLAVSISTARHRRV